MFTVTFRITKKRILAAAAAILLVCAAGMWIKSAMTQIDGDIITPVASPATVKINQAAAKSNDQRIALLQQLGWEVVMEEDEILDVLIPKDMDQTMLQYNEIQTEQGCDLTKYAGKKCKRYTYIVNNYPSGEEDIRVNLIVYKGKVIGGDVCSARLDGFMHGLAKPE